MKGVFFDEDLALGTYRHTVYSLLPSMSKIAWQLKKDEIQRTEPSATRRTFIYNVSHSSYHKRWAEPSRELRRERPFLGVHLAPGAQDRSLQSVVLHASHSGRTEHVHAQL